MKVCPSCQETDINVIDSRKAKVLGCDSVYRRRKCNVCGHRWTTYEIPEEFISRVYEERTQIDKIDEAIKRLEKIRQVSDTIKILKEMFGYEKEKLEKEKK